MASIKNFQTGLWKRKNSGYYYSDKIFLCSCGHSFTDRGVGSNCSVCNNDYFKEVYKFPKTRTLIDSKIDVIEKSDTYFHVRKTEIMAKLENGEKITELLEGNVMEMKVDLKARTLELFNGKGEQIEVNDESLGNFSKNINNGKRFINSVSTDKNLKLFMFGYNQFSKQRLEKYGRIHRGFQAIINNPFLEILFYCGFSPDTIWENRNGINKKETRPYKMIGVPKYILKYLIKLNTLNPYNIRNLIKLDQMINGNNLKTILTILDEESDISYIQGINDRLIEMYDTYGYKDVKKLMLYIAREVKLQQGIDKPHDALTVLRDYARMCKEMNVEYEKYPKSLKKEHDIAMLNYKTQKDEIKKRQFSEVVAKEEYSKLVFKDKEYSIVVPQEPQDVISEGESLSHCVASYVNDIIREKCKILFMRPVKELDTSLLTIEIRDNKFIRQIRGKQNRKAKTEEMSFINKWASKLDLQVEGY